MMKQRMNGIDTIISGEEAGKARENEIPPSFISGIRSPMVTYTASPTVSPTASPTVSPTSAATVSPIVGDTDEGSHALRGMDVKMRPAIRGIGKLQASKYCQGHEMKSDIQGKWSTKAGRKQPEWNPKTCRLDYFTPAQTLECLKGKKISFFGDSLLLAVFNALSKVLAAAGGGKMPTYESTLYTPTGKSHFAYKNSFQNSVLDFHWTPSVSYQTPLDVMPYSDYNERDVAILGMGLWDMGTYYQGIDHYHDKLKSIIQAMRARKPRTLVMNLHKLWPDRCLDPESPCKKCNSEAKETVMREAIAHAVGCIQQYDSSRKTDSSKLTLFDTYPMTNTMQARLDGTAAGDAAHYGDNTTHMEAQILLNHICRKFPTPLVKPGSFPCRPGNNFNGRLSEKGEPEEPCVAKGWKPAHSRR